MHAPDDCRRRRRPTAGQSQIRAKPPWASWHRCKLLPRLCWDMTRQVRQVLKPTGARIQTSHRSLMRGHRPFRKADTTCNLALGIHGRLCTIRKSKKPYRGRFSPDMPRLAGCTRREVSTRPTSVASLPSTHLREFLPGTVFVMIGQATGSAPGRGNEKMSHDADMRSCRQVHHR